MTDLLQSAKNALWAQLKQGYPIKDGKTTYQIDEGNAEAIRDLAHWMVNAPCKYLTHECGIILGGPVGTGKTDIMRALSRTVTEGIRMVSAITIVHQFNKTSRTDNDNGGDKVIEKWGRMDLDLCIDDLGEERTGRHYGAEVDVIAEVIALRYKLWKERGIRTHATTNIVSDEAMLQRYGQRTYDRLMEMCRIVPVTGPSRRGQTSPTAHHRPPLFVLPEPAPTDQEVAEDIARTLEQTARLKSLVKPAAKEAREIMHVHESEEDRLATFIESLPRTPDELLERQRQSFEAGSNPNKDSYLEVITAEQERRKAHQTITA